MIAIEPLQEIHIAPLWEIIRNKPNYFIEELELDKISELNYHLFNTATDVLVGINGGQVIGCGYLTNFEDGFAEVSIITKRHSLHPKETILHLKNSLSYYFKKHDLKFIYAITQASNKAVLRLMKNLGFAGFQFLPDYKLINGRLTDFILGGLLRENLEMEEFSYENIS